MKDNNSQVLIFCFRGRFNHLKLYISHINTLLNIGNVELCTQPLADLNAHAFVGLFDQGVDVVGETTLLSGLKCKLKNRIVKKKKEKATGPEGEQEHKDTDAVWEWNLGKRSLWCKWMHRDSTFEL